MNAMTRGAVAVLALCAAAGLRAENVASGKGQLGEGEEFAPHLNACFLAVDELRRIIFTDALAAGWRPAQQPFMTAIITLDDHPLGTHYAAHVMHRTWSDRDKHEELGFFDGWGTVIGQLANHVEDLL